MPAARARFDAAQRRERHAAIARCRDAQRAQVQSAGACCFDVSYYASRCATPATAAIAASLLQPPPDYHAASVTISLILRISRRH